MNLLSARPFAGQYLLEMQKLFIKYSIIQIHYRCVYQDNFWGMWCLEIAGSDWKDTYFNDRLTCFLNKHFDKYNSAIITNIIWRKKTVEF